MIIGSQRHLPFPIPHDPQPVLVNHLSKQKLIGDYLFFKTPHFLFLGRWLRTSGLTIKSGVCVSLRLVEKLVGSSWVIGSTQVMGPSLWHDVKACACGEFTITAPS